MAWDSIFCYQTRINGHIITRQGLFKENGVFFIMLSYKTDHQGSRPFPRDQTMTIDGIPRLVPVTTV